MSSFDARLTWLREQLPRKPIEGAGGAKYYLRTPLGEGGQGWIYLANYDEPDGLWVVVKLQRPDIVQQDSHKRFQREADVLRKLGQAHAPNPNIVRFYDHGLARYIDPQNRTVSIPYTVLEYIHGPTLADVFSDQAGRGMPAMRARKLFRQIARALAVVHGAQIVHRDLKPSNVLIAHEIGHEVAKITDFGLVKRFDVEVTKGTIALAGATIGYAPPEQFEQGNPRVTERTDIFSFAVVLFEALAGKRPYPSGENESPMQSLSRMLTEPRPLLSSHVATLSPELASQPDVVRLIDDVLGRALSPDPNERPATILEMWDAIEAPLLGAGEPTRELAMRSEIATKMEIEPGPAPSAPSVPSSPMFANDPSISGAAPMFLNEPSHATYSQKEAVSFRPARTSVLPPNSALASYPSDRMRAACFAQGGTMAVALHGSALRTHVGGEWQAMAVPADLVARARGLLTTPAGEIVLFGEGGLLVGLGRDGVARPWASPDATITWTSGHLTPSELLLVGERGGRDPVLGTMPPRSALVVQPVHQSPIITSAARLAAGAVLTIGIDGHLRALRNGRVDEVNWARTGVLTAVASAPDGGAFVVGHGGHALRITPFLEAKLEAVQTTRDLRFVSIGPDGVPWAGGLDARVVRRGVGGWTRLALPPAHTTAVMAIAAGNGRFRVILEDGAVVEAAS